MTRRLLVAVVVIAAAVAGLWTVWRRTAAPATAPAPAAQTAPDAWMALRIQVLAAGPENDVLVAVTAYDRRARQAAIARDATGGRWRGSGAAQDVSAHALPAGWASRLQIMAAGAPIAATVASSDDEGHAALRIPAAAAPADGAALVATLIYDAGEARSNAVSIERPPATPLDRLVARGWQAERIADIDGLMTAGTGITALDATSAWGHYFTGAAHEARGERAAAVEAFRRALARVTPGQEPPIGLIARIRRLSQ